MGFSHDTGMIQIVMMLLFQPSSNHDSDNVSPMIQLGSNCDTAMARNYGPVIIHLWSSQDPNSVIVSTMIGLHVSEW